MKPSSAKAKGRRLQQHVRDRIREVFGLGEDDVLSRSTSAGGEDVVLSPAARERVPFSIECKNTERLQIWKAWEQAKANAGDYEPMVVVSRNRSDVLAVVSLEKLLDLLNIRTWA